MIVPMVASTIGLVVLGLATALIVNKLGLANFSTAYIATSPGAMNALVPMAIDMDVDAALIAHFHFFRIIFVAGTAPILFKFFSN